MSSSNSVPPEPSATQALILEITKVVMVAALTFGIGAVELHQGAKAHDVQQLVGTAALLILGIKK